LTRVKAERYSQFVEDAKEAKLSDPADRVKSVPEPAKHTAGSSLAHQVDPPDSFRPTSEYTCGLFVVKKDPNQKRFPDEYLLMFALFNGAVEYSLNMLKPKILLRSTHVKFLFAGLDPDKKITLFSKKWRRDHEAELRSMNDTDWWRLNYQAKKDAKQKWVDAEKAKQQRLLKADAKREKAAAKEKEKLRKAAVKAAPPATVSEAEPVVPDPDSKVEPVVPDPDSKVEPDAPQAIPEVKPDKPRDDRTPKEITRDEWFFNHYPSPLKFEELLDDPAVREEWDHLHWHAGDTKMYPSFNQYKLACKQVGKRPKPRQYFEDLTFQDLVHIPGVPMMVKHNFCQDTLDNFKFHYYCAYKQPGPTRRDAVPRVDSLLDAWDNAKEVWPGVKIFPVLVQHRQSSFLFVWKLKEPYTKSAPSDIAKEVTDYKESKLHLMVLNDLYDHSKYYPERKMRGVFTRYELIAKRLGCSVRSVDRSILWLIKKRFIWRLRRGRPHPKNRYGYQSFYELPFNMRHVKKWRMPDTEKPRAEKY